MANSMRVGTLQVELVLRESYSLKEKRHVLRSLKDRLQNLYNISVAEVDEQDTWQKAVLGISVVGSEGRHVQEVLSKVVDTVRRHPGSELLDYQIEIFG